MFDKNMKYYPQVIQLFNDYHKYLTGNEYTSRGKPFQFIEDCCPGTKSEILYLMFNAGYETAMKRMGGC